MTTVANAPTPAPTEAPKPANPEPLQHEEVDPEKGRVRTPPPGRSEHPKQHATGLPGEC